MGWVYIEKAREEEFPIALVNTDKGIGSEPNCVFEIFINVDFRWVQTVMNGAQVLDRTLQTEKYWS